jgi:uncharacterized membrane protein YcaP (DUF421 family)
VWHAIWHLGVSGGEKAIRPILIYVFLIVILRLIGKRELGQSNTLDLVVLLLVANAVQNAIIGNDVSVTGGVLGAGILIAANFVLVRAAFMSPRFGKALQGGSTTLYADGRFDEHALRREAITKEELVAALRRQGLELDDVEHVELEPEGTFNATPKPRPRIEDVLTVLERIERKLG